MARSTSRTEKEGDPIAANLDPPIFQDDGVRCRARFIRRSLAFSPSRDIHAFKFSELLKLRYSWMLSSCQLYVDIAVFFEGKPPWSRHGSHQSRMKINKGC